MKKFLFLGTQVVETYGLIEVHADSLEEALENLNHSGPVSVKQKGPSPVKESFKNVILYSTEEI